MSRRSLFLGVLLVACGARFTAAADPEVRSPRVLLIVEKNSARCDAELARLNKPGGDFEVMRALGWQIGAASGNHVQIVNREAVPEIDAALAVREYPAVACIEGTTIVRSFKFGCTTPLDAWTFGFLLTGKDERPKTSIPEATRVATTGHYPLRGNHWSVDGDAKPPAEKLVHHLRGPNHGHQIAAWYAIESWSYEELRSLHDDLHERELANGSSRAYVNRSAARSASRGDSFPFRADAKASWGKSGR